MTRTLTNEPALPVPAIVTIPEPRPLPRNKFVAFITSRKLKWTLIAVAVVAAIVGIPHLFWLAAPDLELKIAVLDKTAAFKDRRDHRGLYWLMQQNKFIDPRFAGAERYYDFHTDYFGFHPDDPPREFTTDLLTNDLLSTYDALYVCDTYGVYVADYEQFKAQDLAATIHSNRIFGGMEPEEVDAIEQFTASGKLLIGEFNTFASPTPPELRERLEQLFGVKWTGWIGRYFLDFQDRRDVPAWLFDLYQQRFGKKWDIRGSGYMLCREESQEFFILHDGAEVMEGGVEFVPTKDYADNDVMQGVEPSKFNYWFDVVETTPGSEVLGRYEFHLTSEGLAKLSEHGLTLTVPAVIRKQNAGYRAYYFAGDFVDFNKAMGPPNNRWTLYINRSYHRHQAPGGQGTFYFHTFYPLVSNILRAESKRLTGRPERMYIYK